MITPVIPDWCKGLPDRTILYSADIMEFFQCNGSYSDNVWALIRKGLIPKPKNKTLKPGGSKRATKYCWTLGEIRELRKVMLEK